MKKLIDTGRISAVYPERCTARVFFEERDFVSGELYIGVRGSQSTKEFWMPSVGEEVICLFLTDSSEGFILCSYYSNKDKPPVADKNKRHIQFEDGTFIEYDMKTHTLCVETKGKINITSTSSINIVAGNNVHVEGDVIAGGISLKNHTHSGVHGMTSSPIGGG